MNAPHHVAVDPLDEATALAVVTSLVTGSHPPVITDDQPRWLYASARDGLITGRYYPRTSSWSRSTDLGADGAGTLSLDTLLAVRLFTHHTETLIRVRPTGGWRGRTLTDTTPAPDPTDPTAPINRTLLLAGGVALPLGSGYHRVTTRSGRSHIVPTDWAPGTHALLIRDYLNTDPDSGAVRIACSRCVDVVTASTPQKAARR